MSFNLETFLHFFIHIYIQCMIFKPVRFEFDKNSLPKGSEREKERERDEIRGQRAEYIETAWVEREVREER